MYRMSLENIKGWYICSANPPGFLRMYLMDNQGPLGRITKLNAGDHPFTVIFRLKGKNKQVFANIDEFMQHAVCSCSQRSSII